MYKERIDQISGIRLRSLRRISVPAGDVLHVLKRSDSDLLEFGEAYFSLIHQGQTKGWKKHTRMAMNLVVPVGEIIFFAYDDRRGSVSYQKTGSTVLGERNYKRLYVPAGVWIAFRGLAEEINLLLNIASIEHDPDEVEVRELSDALFPKLPNF